LLSPAPLFDAYIIGIFCGLVLGTHYHGFARSIAPLPFTLSGLLVAFVVFEDHRAALSISQSARVEINDQEFSPPDRPPRP